MDFRLGVELDVPEADVPPLVGRRVFPEQHPQCLVALVHPLDSVPYSQGLVLLKVRTGADPEEETPPGEDV